MQVRRLMVDKQTELYLEYSRGWMDCFKSKSVYPDGTMMTPEDAFHEYEPGSMGFRMGPGEDYCTQYFKWLSNLSESAKLDYQRSHPRR